MDVITHPFNQILFFSSLNASKSSPTISEISSSVWLFLTSILIAILICVFFHHAQCLVWYPTGFLCLLILQTFHLMLYTLLHHLTLCKEWMWSHIHSIKYSFLVLSMHLSLVQQSQRFLQAFDYFLQAF